MDSLPPQNVNQFIERELTGCLECIGKVFNSDVLTFYGPLILGVDDLFRNNVEALRKRSQRDVLTVIINTAGGYIETVQRIVEAIRYHYTRVNFVVPNYAFSAGTVFVMSGDAIYMDYYSRLGPIDPQKQMPDGSMVAALGLLVKWKELTDKANNGTLQAWELHLMMDGFDQAELYQVEQGRALSVDLLKRWLVKYKFKNWEVTDSTKTPVTDTMREQRAEEIANELNNTDRWHSHGHGISMEVLRQDLNLQIDDFGADVERNLQIRNYAVLLEDYMAKQGHRSAIHIIGSYQPIAGFESA